MDGVVLPVVSALEELSELENETDSDGDVADDSTVASEASCRTNISTSSSRSIRDKLLREGTTLLEQELGPAQQEEEHIHRIAGVLQHFCDPTLGLRTLPPRPAAETLPASANLSADNPFPSVASKPELANKLHRLGSA